MPNYSGIWTSRQQLQAVAAGTWTGFPEAPTSVEYLVVAGGGSG